MTPISIPCGMGSELTRLSSVVESSASGRNILPKIPFAAVATNDPRFGGASITNRPSFVGRKRSSAARAMMQPMLWVTRWSVSIVGFASSVRSSAAKRSACTKIEQHMFR
ncbi:MAG: hypothetical protein DWH79_07525 [Planctomycetota bacterium]|nr:MAG: hypothetical protein DWH79_07525 [Planctomycetota bacterium]